MWTMLNKEQIIASLEETVIKVIKGAEAYGEFLSGDLPDALFKKDAHCIVELSEQYNDPVLASQVKISSERQAAAYSLYYLPINAYKILSVFEHTFRYLPRGSQVTRILDFGCGPATASMVIPELLKGPLQIRAVDNSNETINLARRLMKEHYHGRTDIIFSANQQLAEKEQYDLIIAANVFCEMSFDQAIKTFSLLYSSLFETGILVVIEPALQKATRNLMQLRDTLLEIYPTAAVLFPCTQCHRCPMLKSSDADWCHGTLSWQKPRLVSHFDRLTGYNKHRLKYSALVFGKELSTPPGYRVIQPASRCKAGKEAVLCGKDYFGKVTLPKRMRSEGNRLFEKTRSFDLLDIQNWEVGDTFKPETIISIKKPDSSENQS